VISHVSNIPYQPVNYVNDEKDDRYEDDLIAYGWRQYLESGASEKKLEWLARFPMTRAVVRAMDVVQEISGSFSQPVEQFFVTGASKRGWTTWTTAAVDDRVVGMAPMVIDLLNIVPSFHHHWRCYGEWSPAVDDYVDEGIMDWMDTEEFATLLEMVGPYSFRENLTMPKLLINATCDEFFVTDSWKFYWDDLKGENYLQYVPNVGHGLGGSYVPVSLISFYESVITEREIPLFNWSISDHTIHLEVDPACDYVIRKWEAVNPTARDFRLYVNGEAWMEEPLETTGDGTYAIRISEPENGYKAALLEITIDPDGDFPLTFTTGTLVIPDTYPYEPFKPAPIR
jgi:PhoPQ-activated pathogenicity-related protein